MIFLRVWMPLICFTRFLDINECFSKPCHIQATCTDTFGSFTCTCNTGYVGNGVVCAGLCSYQLLFLLLLFQRFCSKKLEYITLVIDVDECTTLKPCHARATCTNTPGSFSCACNTGFSGNGFTVCDGTRK